MIGRMLMMALVVAGGAYAAPLDAQVRSRRPGAAYSAEPGYWVGLSYGYVDGATINDGDTGTTWQIGYTSQIRATFEKTIQRGISAGVSAGFSNVSMTYATSSFSNACNGVCNATADLSQYMAFVHGGGTGVGFHGVYDLEGGFTEFSNFHESVTNDPLPPTSARYDFTFGFGGGLGYQFTREADAYVSEQLDFVLHPQGTNTSTSAPRLQTFRAGFRVGF